MNHLEKIVNDKKSMEIIVSKKESMQAMIRNTDAFAALIKSQVAMQAVIASDIAMDVITEGFTYYINAKNVLSASAEKITEARESIETILPDNYTAVDECKASTENAIKKLQSVIDQADIIVGNVTRMLSNDAVLTLLLTDTVIIEKLMTNPVSRAAIGTTISEKAALLYTFTPFIDYLKGHATTIADSGERKDVQVTATVYGMSYIKQTYVRHYVNRIGNYYNPNGSFTGNYQQITNSNDYKYNDIGKFGKDFYSGDFTGSTDNIGISVVYGFKF